jgi:hypothetical protein
MFPDNRWNNVERFTKLTFPTNGDWIGRRTSGSRGGRCPGGAIASTRTRFPSNGDWFARRTSWSRGGRCPGGVIASKRAGSGSLTLGQLRHSGCGHRFEIALFPMLGSPKRLSRRLIVDCLLQQRLLGVAYLK